MNGDDPRQEDIRNSDMPREGNLEDSDWNTCSVEQMNFILRGNCHDRDDLRREQFQIENDEDRRPRVLELKLSIDTQPRRHIDPETGHEILDFT